MLTWLFPVPLFTRAHLLRTLLVWFGVRVMTALALLASREVPPPDPIFLPPLLAAYLVGVVAVLAVVDMVMRREQLFLANLGVSRTRAALTSVPVVVALEAAVLVAGAS